MFQNTQIIIHIKSIFKYNRCNTTNKRLEIWSLKYNKMGNRMKMLKEIYNKMNKIKKKY